MGGVAILDSLSSLRRTSPPGANVENRKWSVTSALLYFIFVPYLRTSWLIRSSTFCCCSAYCLSKIVWLALLLRRGPTRLKERGTASRENNDTRQDKGVIKTQPD